MTDTHASSLMPHACLMSIAARTQPPRRSAPRTPHFSCAIVSPQVREFPMSEERAEKCLELFNKGKEFTEELLKENQRLRYRIASLETEHGAGVSSEEVQRLRAEIQQLTDENRRLTQRFREVEEENKDFANRYIEIEEQNNNLANLYVASYQLHSTLDFREVIQIVQEIV